MNTTINYLGNNTWFIDSPHNGYLTNNKEQANTVALCLYLCNEINFEQYTALNTK